VKELEEQFESLNEKLRRLSGRASETSSQPPSADGVKKPNRDPQAPPRKRGPKYNHPGKTRNGFGWVDHTVPLQGAHPLLLGQDNSGSLEAFS